MKQTVIPVPLTYPPLLYPCTEPIVIFLRFAYTNYTLKFAARSTGQSCRHAPRVDYAAYRPWPH